MKNEHLTAYGFVSVATLFWYVTGETANFGYLFVALFSDGIILLPWIRDRKTHHPSLSAIAAVPFIGMCFATIGYFISVGPGSVPLPVAIIVLCGFLSMRVLLTHMALTMHATPTPPQALPNPKAEPLVLEVDGKRVVYTDVTRPPRSR